MLARLLSLLFAASVAQGLDLTARQTMRELEGIRIPQLEFEDGTKRVIYMPPDGWTHSGQSRSLLLGVPDRPSSTAEIRLIAVVSDEERAMPMGEWIKRLLPTGTGVPEIVREVEGSFSLDVRTAQEWIFRFTANGKPMMRSIAVVALSPEERFVTLITAREEDFATTRTEMMRSMSSWVWE